MSKLILERGIIHPALLKLLSELGIPFSQNPSTLNKLLQDKWVQARDGKFRYELGGRLPNEVEVVLLHELAGSEIKPNDSLKYDGVILLGGLLKSVVRRAHLLESINVSQPVFLLGSSRKLNEREFSDKVQGILSEIGTKFTHRWALDATRGWPETEIEMMMRVAGPWLGTDWDLVSVSAPNGRNPDGSSRPANTDDSVRFWLSLAQPGHYLVVSSQPFCENQRMAVERVVRESGENGYSFDVCGPAAPRLTLAQWLDTLAKQLWEEVNLL